MCTRRWQVHLSAVLTIVTACSVSDVARAQKTLTLGGRTPSADRSAERPLHQAVQRARGGEAQDQLHPRRAVGNDMQVIEQMMQGSVQIYGDVLDGTPTSSRTTRFSAGGSHRDIDHLEKIRRQPRAREDGREEVAHFGRDGPAAAGFVCQQAGRQARGHIRQSKCGYRRSEVYVKLWETLGARPSRLAWAESSSASRAA